MKQHPLVTIVVCLCLIGSALFGAFVNQELKKSERRIVHMDFYKGVVDGQDVLVNDSVYDNGDRDQTVVLSLPGDNKDSIHARRDILKGQENTIGETAEPWNQMYFCGPNSQPGCDKATYYSWFHYWAKSNGFDIMNGIQKIEKALVLIRDKEHYDSSWNDSTAKK